MLAAVPATAQQFLNGFAAMPLMEGLTQTDEDLVYFDSPQGGIVQTEASGKVSPARVGKFYSTLLPQLGWRKSGRSWQREDSVLEIKILTEKDTTTVTFKLINK